MNFTLLTFDTLDSTNTEALKQAKSGAPEGLCIIARAQTAGRGRHGRQWSSEKDAGLYVSIVLRPTLETRELPLITLMTGIAVHDALVEFGLVPDIKWVNDVLIDDKKIAGILAETTDTPDGLAVVVGIGINIRSSNMPPALAGTATSIAEVTARAISGSDVTQKLTPCIDHFYAVLRGENGPAAIVAEWSRRSSYANGKSVRAATSNGAITGVTEGLETNGALRVRCHDGSLSIVQAGDVERVRADEH